MKTQFTPGPWDFSYVPGEYGHVITIADGEIAEAFSETVGLEQAVANARLIAAAPELLAALQALLDQTTIERDFDALNQACDQARAALAKATGAQS